MTVLNRLTYKTRRPKLLEIIELPSVTLFKLVWINEVEDGRIVFLVNEDDLPTLVLRKEVADHVPDGADALGVVDECLLDISTVVQVHALEVVVDVSIGNVADLHVVEVHDAHVLLGVVGHHLVSQHYQHQVVDDVVVLLQR